VVYDLLFRAASQTMLTIAADPRHLGARIGITAVLHTWGSALTHHPHIHMTVPGGGISLDGQRWVSSRPAFLLTGPCAGLAVSSPVPDPAARTAYRRTAAVLRQAGRAYRSDSVPAARRACAQEDLPSRWGLSNSVEHWLWRGVRPLGWTESSYCFDRLPGVLIFELRGAEIAQGRV